MTDDGRLPDMFGHTIFADDIRREIGGKISVVGAYNSIMYIHTGFPVALSKFGIWITYFERKGALDQDADVELRVILPTAPEGEPSTITSVIPASSRPKTPLLPRSPDAGSWPEPLFRRIDHQIVAEPLIIPAPGVIKVRAVCGDKVAKIGILRIGRPEPETTEEPVV